MDIEYFKTADDKPAWMWWLRSPGKYQDFAANVFLDGSLDERYIHMVPYDSVCVRPAFWLNLESGIF